ncbi:SIMPL domain-containing protein [Stenotrophomonas riyadhensis]
MKLLSALLWSSLLATMAPSAWAQANTIPSQPHLLVKGEARRVVMPDRFGLQLNIEETDMDADAARRRVQDNVARVLALFKQNKAVEGSVRADNLRIGPAHRYDNGKQVFIGTRVARQLRASFASVQAMQATLAALKANENLQVSSVAPTYSGEVAVRRELKGEAAARTRESAQGLAKAYGTQLRGLYSISDVAPDFAYGIQAGRWPQPVEGEVSGVPEPRLTDITLTGSAAAPAPMAPESIEAGPITYTENVYAIFLISDGT